MGDPKDQPQVAWRRSAKRNVGCRNVREIERVSASDDRKDTEGSMDRKAGREEKTNHIG